MGLKSDLEDEVSSIFRAVWQERDGTVVPDDTTLKLGNDAVKLDATILYADLADSTDLVDNYVAPFAAEVYKTFLHCAAKIIRDERGVITAYDGDRIMAVYIGRHKNTEAARTALKINWTVKNVVQTALKAQYPSSTFVLRHVVGIDTSPVFVAKTGVRGANDLVWVGRAANHAAKLAALPHSHSSYISAEVYDALHESAKTSTSGQSMWEPAKWEAFDRIIYRSTFWWSVV